MARDRLRGIRRLVGLQRKLRSLEEQRLADLGRRDAELEEAQEAILGTLGRGFVSGRFGAVLARHAGRLANDALTLQVQRERQLQLVRDQTVKLRQAEQTERSLAVEDRRDDEKRRLTSLIDLLAERGGTRPG